MQRHSTRQRRAALNPAESVIPLTERTMPSVRSNSPLNDASSSTPITSDEEDGPEKLLLSQAPPIGMSAEIGPQPRI
jgi:hypothetical protein